jgi:hypothetical protein
MCQASAHFYHVFVKSLKRPDRNPLDKINIRHFIRLALVFLAGTDIQELCNIMGIISKAKGAVGAKSPFFYLTRNLGDRSENFSAVRSLTTYNVHWGAVPNSAISSDLLTAVS